MEPLPDGALEKAKREQRKPALGGIFLGRASREDVSYHKIPGPCPYDPRWSLLTFLTRYNTLYKVFLFFSPFTLLNYTTIQEAPATEERKAKWQINP